MLSIPHCVDNQLTDGGKVVSPTHPPHFTPHKHYYTRIYVSGTHFCSGLSKPQGLVQPEGLGKFKNSPHRVSNPLLSSLQHSSLTTTHCGIGKVNYPLCILVAVSEPDGSKQRGSGCLHECSSDLSVSFPNIELSAQWLNTRTVTVKIENNRNMSTVGSTCLFRPYKPVPACS
jgi:hypothetical protein